MDHPPQLRRYKLSFVTVDASDNRRTLRTLARDAASEDSSDAPHANSGFYGNMGRDTLIGPGSRDMGFPAFKTTMLRERLSLQFRAEIFNLLNRANFNTPNLITFASSNSGTKTSGTAGAITSYFHEFTTSSILA